MLGAPRFVINWLLDRLARCGGAQPPGGRDRRERGRVGQGVALDYGELYWQWSTDDSGSVEGRLLIDEADRCTLQVRNRLQPAARITGELGNGQTVTLLDAHETRRGGGE